MERSQPLEWFLNGDRIAREVITSDIQKYLGPDAVVRPMVMADGQSGYRITAHRTLTQQMIQMLIDDSLRWTAGRTQSTIQESYGEEELDSQSTVPEDESESFADVCGWQIGEEKFLWDFDVATNLQATERGLLGRGSIGEVEEVEVPGYYIPLARKRIFISRSRTQAAREIQQIRAEIENLKLLHHEHIVRILGCYQERRGVSSMAICALLYPAGDDDLSTFLQDVCPNAASEDWHGTYRLWIRQWFFCLASALTYMHSCGIHHEDIKPSNIVHRGARIFFTDFSSSRRVANNTDTSTASPAMASRLFAAPEALGVAEGAPQRHGSQTDVFSLGLVFLEMMTVFYGYTISDLHTALFAEGTTIKEYHRVVHKINSLGIASWPVDKYLLYMICISRMIRVDRATRPRAAQIGRLLFEVFDPLLAVCPSSTHLSHETGPQSPH